MSTERSARAGSDELYAVITRRQGDNGGRGLGGAPTRARDGCHGLVRAAVPELTPGERYRLFARGLRRFTAVGLRACMRWMAI
jgi:hypothetical protein